MKLNLYWEDKENRIYNLGELSKDNNKYIFTLNKGEYDLALSMGCIGIGNLGKGSQTSNELFSFFKERIPGKENPRIKSYLILFGMEEYDEMELLKKSKAKVVTDKFYVEGEN